MTVTDLGNGEDYPFLILACDGVWDVFSDQEAVDLILERYLVEGSYEDAAELLVSMFVDNDWGLCLHNFRQCVCRWSSRLRGEVPTTLRQLLLFCKTDAVPNY